MWDVVMIRHGEISLKGRNRSRFEKQLAEHLKAALVDYPKIGWREGRHRVYIELNGEPAEEVGRAVGKVFGIHSYSLARTVPLDPDVIARTGVEVVQSLTEKPGTFKVDVRRTNKSFPWGTQEMNHRIGSEVLRSIEGLKVDVHNPDLKLNVEIRSERAYIYGEPFEGAGGMPYGTNGKAMLMLSGGIDSPVAGYLTMKRGVIVEAVHFYSYPYTSEKAKQKVIDIASVLSQYSGGVLMLHLVPFTDVQMEIRKHCQESLSVTIMRRIMLRIVERLAEQRKALGIATGESLGQVASQTLESMWTIHRATSLPILQPVIAMDKAEITRWSEKIGTYDLSILPYEDCCTVFLPKSPATKPNLWATERSEALLPMERLIEQAVANTERIKLTPKGDEAKAALQEFF
jgi:thiamine biosynthesis protein ThiI